LIREVSQATVQISGDFADPAFANAVLKHDLGRGHGRSATSFGPEATSGEAVFVPASADAARDDGYVMASVHNPETAARLTLVHPRGARTLWAEPVRARPPCPARNPARLPRETGSRTSSTGAARLLPRVTPCASGGDVEPWSSVNIASVTRLAFSGSRSLIMSTSAVGNGPCQEQPVPVLHPAAGVPPARPRTAVPSSKSTSPWSSHGIWNEIASVKWACNGPPFRGDELLPV